MNEDLHTTVSEAPSIYKVSMDTILVFHFRGKDSSVVNYGKQIPTQISRWPS